MALIDDSYALITTAQRSIGGIIPDCAVEEHHSDRLIITEHPVETGAAITDHAYRSPSEVVMKIGFSNSTARTEGWVQEAYQMLLSLQQQRQPFDLSTGKRQYANMLVDSIEVVTDPASEWVLNCTIGLREIILTSTAQSSAGSSATTAAPSSDPAAQTNPSATGGASLDGTAQVFQSQGAPTFQQVQEGTMQGGLTFDQIAQGNGFSPGAGGPGSAQTGTIEVGVISEDGAPGTGGSITVPGAPKS